MSNKKWLHNTNNSDIINSITVKDNENRFDLTVFEKERFLVEFGQKDLNPDSMLFTKEEFRKIYEFLKPYYE